MARPGAIPVSAEEGGPGPAPLTLPRPRPPPLNAQHPPPRPLTLPAPRSLPEEAEPGIAESPSRRMFESGNWETYGLAEPDTHTIRG